MAEGLIHQQHLDGKVESAFGDLGITILKWARKEFADEAWAYYHEIEHATLFQKRIHLWRIPTVKVTIKGHDLRFLFVALFGPEPA